MLSCALWHEGQRCCRKINSSRTPGILTFIEYRMSTVKEFVLNNFKTLIIIVSFIITIYVQHIANVNQIAELNTKCATLELKIQDQYEKIDAIKLDKTVFEANMAQFTSIQTDLREMREDIKELLKNQK